jgi:hypothetical protein
LKSKTKRTERMILASERAKGSLKRRGSRRPSTKYKPKAKVHTKHWDDLNPKWKELRVRSLAAIRSMRAGKSLTFSAKLVGISPRALKSHLGSYIYKKGHRWKARKKDRIERGMTIYERGMIRSIILNDSETASLIGEYFNDVKRVLESGNLRLLEKYRKAIIKDSKGRRHRLELRIELIEQIELGRENVEFADIYAY